MYSTPVATLVSSDTDNRFCPGTTVVFTAGGGVSFNFRVDGISVQNGSSNSYTTSLLTNGQVVDVIVTNANGCSATSQPVTNTVFTLPVATLSSSDNDNTFCAGSTVIFTAGGGVNYTFRLAGTTVQNGPSVTYTTSSVANGQVVDVIVTNSSGCSALSTGITNLVNPLPTPSITSSDQDNTFCTGATITFTASGGNNYIFRVGGVTVQNSASTSYATDALADGQVVDVVVSDINNCQVISPGITNHVILHHVPDVSAGQDTSICIGGSAQLKATGDGTFSWLPVTDLSDPLIDNPVTGTDTTITYTVTLTDQYGCQNSDEVKVTVLEPPVTFAGDDMVLEYIFTVQLEASPLKDGETGQWSVDSGSGEFSDPDGANSTVSGMHLGENILLWTVTNHVCPSAADYIRIVVNDLIVPTLITPNGDPFNEYFMLRGIETLGLTELTIFDRRGAMVYRNRAYDNSWNGVDHNGNPLPDDTYFYVIKSQNGKSLSGYIVIRR
jgi:gliding motility-associated-like protein